MRNKDKHLKIELAALTLLILKEFHQIFNSKRFKLIIVSLLFIGTMFMGLHANNQQIKQAMIKHQNLISQELESFKAQLKKQNDVFEIMVHDLFRDYDDVTPDSIFFMDKQSSLG